MKYTFLNNKHIDKKIKPNVTLSSYKKLNILKMLDTEKKKKNPEPEFPRNYHSTGCDNSIQCEVLQTSELVF